MTTNMKIPGAAWVALILAIIGWLQGDWFAGQEWVAGVVLGLGLVAKLIEVYIVKPPTVTSTRGDARPAGSRWLRVVWGG